MPKVIQGLEKRMGSILFVSKGQKIEKGELRVGDIAKVKKKDGTIFSIRVDVIQEEGTFLGTIENIFHQKIKKEKGIACGNVVVENMDFVFEINRTT